MIDGMPRTRPPYLQRVKTRHGKFVWVVRKNHGPRIRIHGEFGTPEFQAAYEAAVAGLPVSPSPARTKAGSLQWLWERYRETSAWHALSPATRRQRENIMDGVLRSAGDTPYTAIGRKEIEAGKERRRATPSQARNFLDTMRGLFRWAVAAGLCAQDPTAAVKNPPRRQSPGFPAWDSADVAAFEARWPTGTRQRVWLHVLLYTGLRRGDAVRLGRQHVKDGIASIKTEKTGVQVNLPVLPALRATLDHGPCGDLAFICGAGGEPLTKESFGNLFSQACRAAGIEKSAHGVRKLAATILAENGATVAELEAIFGWQGGAMASLYTRAADRKRLALSAMHKLARNEPSTG